MVLIQSTSSHMALHLATIRDCSQRLLRYAFQVTDADLAETGWKDDEIKQSKFPVLERADGLCCFNIIDNKE